MLLILALFLLWKFGPWLYPDDHWWYKSPFGVLFVFGCLFAIAGGIYKHFPLLIQVATSQQAKEILEAWWQLL